jgi:hypothetical protein
MLKDKTNDMSVEASRDSAFEATRFSEIESMNVKVKDYNNESKSRLIIEELYEQELLQVMKIDLHTSIWFRNGLVVHRH